MNSFDMVHAYHLVFGTYGFWLPNDPRGSGSDFVASWPLLKHGRATKTDSRRSVAHAEHDHAKRIEAKKSLKRPPVVLTGSQALSAAKGFSIAAKRSGLVIWACAILPEHVHLVVARHRLRAETIVNLLKGAATRAMTKAGEHPCLPLSLEDESRPSPWAVGHWKVFLNSQQDVERTIDYVASNPMREGKRLQKWSFVVPFEGLPDD